MRNLFNNSHFEIYAYSVMEIAHLDHSVTVVQLAKQTAFPVSMRWYESSSLQVGGASPFH